MEPRGNSRRERRNHTSPRIPLPWGQCPNNLLFKTHIDNIVSKGKKRVRIIKCICTKSWSNSLETQRQDYQQYVCSRLEYASPSWNAWISKTKRDRLQRVQDKALRSAAGLAKTCPTDFLHLETGVEPLDIRLEKNGQVVWEKYHQDRMTVVNLINQPENCRRLAANPLREEDLIPLGCQCDPVGALE